MVLSLGFAHKVNYQIPEGIDMKVEQDPKGNTVVFISGINKELVGEVAAKVRAYKKPEPYKGKVLDILMNLLRLRQVNHLRNSSLDYSIWFYIIICLLL